MIRHRFLTLLLGASLFCAVPALAQAKKGAYRGNVPAPLPLPLLLGAAMGGLVLGGVLGFSFKKAPVMEAKVDTGPGTAFDDAPLPLALVDSREKITRANAAFGQYFGIENAVGVSLPDLFHPDDLARGRTLLHDVFGGDHSGFELASRFFRPDGTLLHAKISVKKQGEARKPDNVLIGLDDATELAVAQNELVGARAAVSSLYEVIAGDKSLDLDGKMKSLLTMGCGRFELPIGVLGRFAGNDFETLFVQSPDRRVRPAMILPRSDISTLEAQLLGFKSLPNPNNWKKVPFISSNENITYFGAPVLVDTKLFGMLSFSSIEPREKPFDSGDAELLQLMADWVGGEIEREHARLTLEEQQTALVEANAKLEALATHDPLTEAKNRRAFNDKLAEEWSRATRYGTHLSLVLIDVDKFKLYNDTYGHPAGDEVLKRVARTMMAAVRGTDFFARYGGEEFVLLLPNTDADGAMILAERLRQKIQDTGWKESPVTASMGVASLLPDYKNSADLTQAADNALYYSKEHGRNRVTHVRDYVTPAAA